MGVDCRLYVCQDIEDGEAVADAIFKLDRDYDLQARIREVSEPFHGRPDPFAVTCAVGHDPDISFYLTAQELKAVEPRSEYSEWNNTVLRFIHSLPAERWIGVEWC